MVANNKIEALLVFQTSRFFRNGAEARAVKTALRKRGIRVIAICQEMTDDPMGEFVEGIFELVDEYESDVNGMRTAAAMRENAKRGFFNGSSAPFGFVAERVEVAPGRFKRKLVQCQTEARVAAQVFRLYVEGAGAKATAGELNRRAIRYRGGRKWTKDDVLRVIGESAAVGEYYWGKRDNRTRHPRPPEEWIRIEVEPIIDRELYEAAQRVRAARDPERVAGRTGSSPLLLAGLVRCGHCGASYTLETSGKQAGDGSRPHKYYNCRTFLRSGKEACPGHRLRAEALDEAVLEHAADRIFTGTGADRSSPTLSRRPVRSGSGQPRNAGLSETASESWSERSPAGKLRSSRARQGTDQVQHGPGQLLRLGQTSMISQ